MEIGFEYWVFIARWLHVLSGVMWIGLLWYFNFVQTPTVPTIPEELRPAIPKHIMPVALFWFRWAALATIVTGLILAWMNGYLVNALAIGLTDNVAKHASIGFGMWMGLIMAFNVWFIIWPNQQIVLGMKEGDGPAAAAKAGLASRTNTLFSGPMLLGMLGSKHLAAISTQVGGSVSDTGLFTAMGIIIALEINALFGGMGPMKSVMGVIHCSLALMLAILGILLFL